MQHEIILEQLRGLTTPHRMEVSVSWVNVADAGTSLSKDESFRFIEQSLEDAIADPGQPTLGAVSKAIEGLASRLPGASGCGSAKFALHQLPGVVLQVELPAGGSRQILKSTYIDALYDPANDQLSIFVAGSGPAAFDMQSLTRPIVATNSNVDWLATAEWTLVHSGAEGESWEFRAPGTSGSGVVSLSDSGDIVGASSTMGSSEFRRALWLQWSDGEGGARWVQRGAYASTQGGSLDAYAFNIDSVNLDPSAKDVGMSVPTSANVVDFRSIDTAVYSMARPESLPAEIKDVLAGHDAVGVAVTHRPDGTEDVPARAQGVSPLWFVLAVAGLLAGSLVMVKHRAGKGR